MRAGIIASAVLLVAAALRRNAMPLGSDDLVQTAKRLVFEARGKQPMSLGYAAFKTREIQRAIAHGLPDGELPPGWGARLDERLVEYPWLFARLPAGRGRLLDAGSALNFEYLLGLPRLAEKQIYIATLAPEPDCAWKRSVSYVFEDLRHLGFRDGWFDWVVSISTVEHIGMDNTLFYSANEAHKERTPQSRVEALREMRRVLRPGGTLLLTVPFGAAADHGWLQVLDGAALDELIAAFGPARVTETHFRYEEAGWVRSSREASKHCTYSQTSRTHRSEPDFAAAARAVACLELVAASPP